MLMILKTELEYTKVGLAIGYLVAFLFFLGAIFFDEGALLGFMINSAITYFIAMAIVGSEADKEKRLRFQSLLPVPSRHLGLVDQIYLVIFQAGIVVLWLAMLLFKPYEITTETFASMASFNGLVLAGINIFVVFSHLGHFNTNRYRWIGFGLLLLAVFVLAALIYFGYIISVWRFLSALFWSPAGGAIFTILWLAMAFWSTVLFARRKSYLA